MTVPARLLLLIALITCPLAVQAGDSRPNIVIIILDDWGWDASGAYGNHHIQTPTIDALARQGAKFNNMFLTASTCTSSRASILTGLHPFATGAPRLGTDVAPGRKLVSDYLRRSGYYTASIGKWHLGPFVHDQFDFVLEERPALGDRAGGEEDWVDTIRHRLPANKPFFLWLAAKDPHRPWYDESHWAVHKPETLDIPAYIEINATHPPEFVRKELTGYYNEIHRADFYINEVINALKTTHHLDNTVIMLMSDNGPPFWRAKKFLTTPGVKTPFIVYWPGRINNHREVDPLLSAVDIAPTILDLAGVPVPAAMEGKSFASMLTGNEAHEINTVIYGERGDSLLGSPNGRSIRDTRYLYIMDDYKTYIRCPDKAQQDPDRGEQLYDVVADPDNLHNLAPDGSLLRSLWRRINGQRDYRPVLLHYRQLMQERRVQRQDLPEPVIDADCPAMWWRDAPATKNIPSPAND